MIADAAVPAARAVETDSSRAEHRAIYWLWALFWVFMTVVEIQDHLYNVHIRWWEPLLWQFSSATPTTAWLVFQQRHHRYSQYLPRPLSWFWHHVKWLPLVAVSCITFMYLTRHGVYLLVGRHYNHDIQMPGLNGLEIAAQLETATAPLLVFVTAYDEHAVKAFELNAVDYLLKPYDKERLGKCLSRVRARLGDAQVHAAGVGTARTQLNQRSLDSGRLLVPVGEQLHLIEVASIEWLEADDNYVHVHAAGRKYLLRRTLTDLLAQLGEQRFARIHKSAAVNLAQVQVLTPLFKGDYEVVLHTAQRLRMSRRYRDAVFARMRR